eukprot:scaffold271437_cov27-Tisochrysis_lutea.AAC.4
MRASLIPHSFSRSSNISVDFHIHGSARRSSHTRPFDIIYHCSYYCINRGTEVARKGRTSEELAPAVDAFPGARSIPLEGGLTRGQKGAMSGNFQKSRISTVRFREALPSHNPRGVPRPLLPQQAPGV